MSIKREKPVRVGVIGCGAISSAYMSIGKKFRNIEIVACADLDIKRARVRAKEFEVPRACSVKQLLADKTIEIIINLTVPKAHASVSLKALKAGKNVYNEKPFAVTREEAKEIIDLADENGLLVGGAPDTFLGGAHQTCRKLIDDGWIGDPVATNAFMMGHGHESWHPDPEFYYEKGGGPMFDMGPYYLTAMVNMMGPVGRVMGCTRVTFPERTITSEKKYGKVIRVDTPTHVVGIMEFKSGAIGQLTTSFDVWGTRAPNIEVHGTEGSLIVPDPNGFGGTVLYKWRNGDWKEVPLAYGYIENSRSIGVADMARGLRTGTKHRANGRLAYHILDLMHSFHDASEKRGSVTVKSTCSRPKPLPLGLASGEVEC